MSNMVIFGYALTYATAASRPIVGSWFGGYITTSDVTVVPHPVKFCASSVVLHFSTATRTAAESCGVNASSLASPFSHATNGNANIRLAAIRHVVRIEVSCGGTTILTIAKEFRDCVPSHAWPRGLARTAASWRS